MNRRDFVASAVGLAGLLGLSKSVKAERIERPDYTAVIGRNKPEIVVDVRSNDSHIVKTIVEAAKK